VRPLDFLPSIKLKLGVAIVAAVVVTGVVVGFGDQLGLSPLLTGLVAAALALALVQVLAHGMTYPLRQMVAAARAMARGDYDRHVVATSRDEVGELARAFNTMAAELAEVDRVRRDLVANASHELRTPIGALRAKLENLVDGIEEASPDALAELLGQVERLGDTVEQLLDLAKLESGAVPLASADVQAADLLDRLAGDWTPRLGAKRLRLEVRVDPRDLAMFADEARLRQALDNLVANAVRHSPGGGEVRVHAYADHGKVWLTVSDDGPGIPPSEAERVFERFYRSDRARASGGGGSGLGLAIARWVVELHGGTICVDQTASNGCRMVVELPR